MSRSIALGLESGFPGFALLGPGGWGGVCRDYSVAQGLYGAGQLRGIGGGVHCRSLCSDCVLGAVLVEICRCRAKGLLAFLQSLGFELICYRFQHESGQPHKGLDRQFKRMRNAKRPNTNKIPANPTCSDVPLS